MQIAYAEAPPPVMVMSTARVSTAVLLAACCGTATAHSRTVEVVTSVDGTVAVHVDVDIAAISKVVVDGADNSFTLEAFAALRGARWVQAGLPQLLSSFSPGHTQKHTNTHACEMLLRWSACGTNMLVKFRMCVWPRGVLWLHAVHADRLPCKLVTSLHVAIAWTGGCHRH